MIGAREYLEIDAVDFQIACRRYTIHATITRDRQLPVVDEFVLRLLAILDRMPLSRMRAWFGFTTGEMQTVLVDMSQRGHVEFEGDDVMLAPAGRDLFKSSGGESAPQVVEVAPLIADVWFDLVSRSIVPRSTARSAEYLVKMTENPTARELPEDFAKKAFEENFRDYVRRIRRLPDADSVNLYSISGVEGGAYGYQVLEAGLVLDMDRQSIRPTFGQAAESASGFQKLAVAAGDAWRFTSAPDLTAASAAEFERITGESRLAPLLAQPEEIDAWTTALVLREELGAGFQPTVGATYLQRNRTQLIQAVHASKMPLPKEVVWARPNGSTWGRTTQVGEALIELRNALATRESPDVETALIMPRSTPKHLRMTHKKLFSRGRLSPQGHLPPNLEVLLVPGVAALVNVHVPMGRHAVPIGGLLTETRRLARLTERLRPGRAEGWEEIWQPIKAPKG